MKQENTKKNIKIVVFGPRHAGKTIFLAALANCSTVSVTDSESISLLKQNWEMLKRGETPPATAGILRDIYFTFRMAEGVHRHACDIVISDYDGQLAETLSQQTEDISEKRALRERLRHADGIVIFFPVDSEDATTAESWRIEIGFFIKTLQDVCTEGEQLSTPLVIAVNKWDKHEAFCSEAEDVAAKKFILSIEIYRVIYEKLENFFSDIIIIPISSYGHKSPDNNPVPGRISPYRVDESVAVLVLRAYSALQGKVSSLNDAGMYAELASTLLGSRPLWARCEWLNYASLLDDALTECAAALLTRLQAATNLREFDQSLKNSPEFPLMQEFSKEQREPIELLRQQLRKKICRLRARCLLKIGTFTVVLLIPISLGIAHCQRSIDFDKAMNDRRHSLEVRTLLENYEKKYGNHWLLSGLYQDDLEKIRERRATLEHDMRQQLTEGRNILTDMADSCERVNAAERLLAEQRDIAAQLDQSFIADVQALRDQSQRICQCRSILNDPQATPKTLIEARALLSDLPDTTEVLKTRDDLSKRLADMSQQLVEARNTLAGMTDPCERVNAAERLLVEQQDIAAQLDQSFMTDVQTFRDQSQRICQCRSILSDPQSGQQELSAASHLLQGLPDTVEVLDLKKGLKQRLEEFRVQEICKELDALYSPELNNDGYEEAKNLLEKYHAESNEAIRNRLKKIEDSLGERLCCFLLQYIEKINVHNFENSLSVLKNKIRKEVQNNQIKNLDAEHRQRISLGIQSRLEKYEDSRIRNLSLKISSKKNLIDYKETLRELAGIADSAKLDDGLFTYVRPPKLDEDIKNIQREIEKCERALNDGVNASWTLYAIEENSVDANCGILANADLEFSFGAINGSYNDQNFQCIPTSFKGFSWEFKFGLKTTYVLTENIIITEENVEFQGFNKSKSISDELSITEADIFTLLSGNALEKYLYGGEFLLEIKP